MDVLELIRPLFYVRLELNLELRDLLKMAKKTAAKLMTQHCWGITCIRITSPRIKKGSPGTFPLLDEVMKMLLRVRNGILGGGFKFSHCARSTYTALTTV